MARFQVKAMQDPEEKVSIKSGNELEVQKIWEKIRTKNKTDIWNGNISDFCFHPVSSVTWFESYDSLENTKTPEGL